MMGFGKSSWVTLAAMLVLLVLPLVFYFSGNTFYLSLATRLTILAIAAVSLNLVSWAPQSWELCASTLPARRIHLGS